MLHREIALAHRRRSLYVVHRSNATRVALSAFLDVSSLNLAVPSGAAFFLPERISRATAPAPSQRLQQVHPPLQHVHPVTVPVAGADAVADVPHHLRRRIVRHL